VASLGAPFLLTLFLWWFSTGAILLVMRQREAVVRIGFLVASVLALLALWGLSLSSRDVSISGVYVAFGCALALWGWNEMAFLLGHVTGPRRVEASPGARGWRRFVEAAEAVLYHEIALVLSVGAVALATAGGNNRTGLWTILILFAMRLSAKLNIYLGVSNTTEQFLPPRLAYLKSYFRKRSMNLLFPVTVSFASIGVWLLWREAMLAQVNSVEGVSAALLATLLALGVVEHWFLVVPLPAALFRALGFSAPEVTPTLIAPPLATADSVRLMAEGNVISIEELRQAKKMGGSR
jgi:putative photosynthetic complex assembly protein 2